MSEAPPLLVEQKQSPSQWLGARLKQVIKSREIGILAALVVLILVVSILRYPAFLTSTNLFNLSRQIAFTAIVAIGVLFVILTGGVDLSLGSTVGLTGFMCGVAFFMWQAPPLLAAIIGVATGALVGAFNGSIVSYVGVTPFIVTLGMLTAGRSIIYLIFNGANITQNVPDVFSAIANGSSSDIGTWTNNSALIWIFHHLLPGIPIPVIILIVVALVCHIVLTYSTFGRRIYAIGGNEEATHLSGINVKAIKFFAYVVCSVLCSITGLLYIGRFRSAVANAGVGMELDAIAAAVIGGTSLMGGTGSVIGVVIGACIMGVVSNAITLLEIKSEGQGLIIGGIIIAAAILDVTQTRKSTLASHTRVFALGILSTIILVCDCFLVDARVRPLFVPVLPLSLAVIILVAILVQFTSFPKFASLFVFTRLRPGAREIVIAILLVLFLWYLLTVKFAWGMGLILTGAGIYLVLTSFFALKNGRPASPAVQRFIWIALAILSALNLLYFAVILFQDFTSNLTILNDQRIPTLLVLATIGLACGLLYASIRPLVTSGKKNPGS